MNRKLRDGLARISVDLYTEIEGDLDIPEHSRALAVFVHGSSQQRRSPRNRAMARFLREIGIGTFMVDLLSEEEEEIDQVTRHLRFDVELLAQRVATVLDWIKKDTITRQLPVGLMGSSTGAAAALTAAAERPEEVEAVVSKGGRPDLARDALEKVVAPTLLLAGSEDRLVLEMNHRAQERLKCDHELEVIRGAGPQFEEPGTLEKAAEKARRWLLDYLIFEKHRMGAPGMATASPKGAEKRA